MDILSDSCDSAHNLTIYNGKRVKPNSDDQLMELTNPTVHEAVEPPKKLPVILTTKTLPKALLPKEPRDGARSTSAYRPIFQDKRFAGFSLASNRADSSTTRPGAADCRRDSLTVTPADGTSQRYRSLSSSYRNRPPTTTSFSAFKSSADDGGLDYFKPSDGSAASGTNGALNVRSSTSRSSTLPRGSSLSTYFDAEEVFSRSGDSGGLGAGERTVDIYERDSVVPLLKEALSGRTPLRSEENCDQAIKRNEGRLDSTVSIRPTINDPTHSYYNKRHKYDLAKTKYQVIMPDHIKTKDQIEIKDQVEIKDHVKIKDQAESSFIKKDTAAAEATNLTDIDKLINQAEIKNIAVIDQVKLTNRADPTALTNAFDPAGTPHQLTDPVILLDGAELNNSEVDGLDKFHSKYKSTAILTVRDPSKDSHSANLNGPVKELIQTELINSSMFDPATSKTKSPCKQCIIYFFDPTEPSNTANVVKPYNILDQTIIKNIDAVDQAIRNNRDELIGQYEVTNITKVLDPAESSKSSDLVDPVGSLNQTVINNSEIANPTKINTEENVKNTYTLHRLPMKSEDPLVRIPASIRSLNAQLETPLNSENEYEHSPLNQSEQINKEVVYLPTFNTQKNVNNTDSHKIPVESHVPDRYVSKLAASLNCSNPQSITPIYSGNERETGDARQIFKTKYENRRLASSAEDSDNHRGSDGAKESDDRYDNRTVPDSFSERSDKNSILNVPDMFKCEESIRKTETMADANGTYKTTSWTAHNEKSVENVSHRLRKSINRFFAQFTGDDWYDPMHPPTRRTLVSPKIAKNLNACPNFDTTITLKTSQIVVKTQRHDKSKLGKFNCELIAVDADDIAADRNEAANLPPTDLLSNYSAHEPSDSNNPNSIVSFDIDQPIGSDEPTEDEYINTFNIYDDIYWRPPPPLPTTPPPPPSQLGHSPRGDTRQLFHLIAGATGDLNCDQFGESRDFDENDDYCQPAPPLPPIPPPDFEARISLYPARDTPSRESSAFVAAQSPGISSASSPESNSRTSKQPRESRDINNRTKISNSSPVDFFTVEHSVECIIPPSSPPPPPPPPPPPTPSTTPAHTTSRKTTSVVETTIVHSFPNSTPARHRHYLERNFAESVIVENISACPPTPPVVDPVRYHHEASDSFRSEDSGIDRSSDLGGYPHDEGEEVDRGRPYSFSPLLDYPLGYRVDGYLDTGYNANESGFIKQLLLDTEMIGRMDGVREGCCDEDGEEEVEEEGVITVQLDKDEMGLGFTIEGGVGAVDGDRPITKKKKVPTATLR